MRRQPALTFAGALKILARRERGPLEKLDKLLGGLILSAGAVTGVATVATAGTAGIASAGLLVAIWGWVDQKNEAISLLRALTERLPRSVKKTEGLERRELVTAAHTAIVIAAYFEVLRESLGKKKVQQLEITDQTIKALIERVAKPSVELTHEWLYNTYVPAPSAARGFHENVKNDLTLWYKEFAEVMARFVGGLAVEANLPTSKAFRLRVVKRYESLYVNLAAEVPEFSIWLALNEHAVTRKQIGVQHEKVSAALEVHGNALAQVEALLRVLCGIPGELGPRRTGLNAANEGMLDEPIVKPERDQAPGNVTFPPIRRIFITPNYRIASAVQECRPSDENWWERNADRRTDLEKMLATYLSSIEAVSLPMLLLGHPGAGKSLLMKALAAQLPVEDYTVVRVPLRAVTAGAPIVEQIEQALGIATNGRVEWKPLTDEGINTVRLVLLDGLDELLQATSVDRSSYLLDIVDFQRRELEQGFPVVVIVTSRTVVADRVEVPNGATIVKLEEFDKIQIGQWLRTWRTTNSAAIAAGTMGELTLEEAQHQISLARQPLLLLVLALYAADLASPSLDAGLSKAALYEQIFHFFARREVLKDQSHGLDDHGVEIAILDQIHRLAVAGLAMFNRGVQYVREPDLRADLVALTKQQDLNHHAGRRLLGEFFFVHTPEAQVLGQERAYEFLHATFGEYLVARHVFSELVDASGAAYGDRRSREVDDVTLFALLSHQSWASRPSLLEFAQEMFIILPDEQKEGVIRALTELLASYKRRRRAATFDDYRPMSVDFLRQLAAYSANLVSMLAGFSSSGFRTCEIFGCSYEDAEYRWQELVLLWRSVLGRTGWYSLASSLVYSDGVVSFSPSGSASSITAHDGFAEYYFSRFMGDRKHALRVRFGISFFDHVLFGREDDDWKSVALSWLGDIRGYMHIRHEVFNPPSNASPNDIEEVARGHERALAENVTELTVEDINGSLEYFDRIGYAIGPRAIIAIVLRYPEILFTRERWLDPSIYHVVRREMQFVLALIRPVAPDGTERAIENLWRGLAESGVEPEGPVLDYADIRNFLRTYMDLGQNLTGRLYRELEA